ncbi:hypothetical protein [Bacillus sp. AK031]
MKEVRDNVKYAGLILAVSLIMYLAYGYGEGEFDSKVFILFFTGAVFGQGVGFMRNNKKHRNTL